MAPVAAAPAFIASPAAAPLAAAAAPADLAASPAAVAAVAAESAAALVASAAVVAAVAAESAAASALAAGLLQAAIESAPTAATPTNRVRRILVFMSFKSPKGLGFNRSALATRRDGSAARRGTMRRFAQIARPQFTVP